MMRQALEGAQARRSIALRADTALWMKRIGPSEKETSWGIACRLFLTTGSLRFSLSNIIADVETGGSYSRIIRPHGTPAAAAPMFTHHH